MRRQRRRGGRRGGLVKGLHPMRNPGDPEDKSSIPNVKRKSLRALVNGRVQGVGYRFFVLREARRLALTGLARNLPDGRVEVYAQGDPDSLRELVSQLERGPVLSRVDRVDVEWGVEVPHVADFTIG